MLPNQDELRPSYRQQLHDLALDHYGYVTSWMAADLGIPVVELGKLSTRNHLIPVLAKVAYGLYRFEDIPVTARDQHMEAVLRVGSDAFLIGDAVLSLHSLALVLPRRMRVGTPRRLRPTLPAWLEMVRVNVPEKDLTTYEGIPSMTVGRALLDCRGRVMQDRLLEGAHKAEQEGLLLRREVKSVFAELEKPLT